MSESPTTTAAQLHAALATAHAFFQQATPSSWVPAYIASRGLAAVGEDVGFAQPGDGLREHLLQRGHSVEVQTAAGLLHPDTGRPTFYNRLTVPIRDAGGSVTGFTARCSPKANDGTPKYINTRGTDVYRKNEALLGIDELAAAPTKMPVIVEGAMDRLAVKAVSDRLGIVPLATCGTALTAEHVQRIMATAPGRPIAVGFDADRAGSKATLAAWELLADAALAQQRPKPGRLLHITWPAGLDPADLVKAGRGDDLRRAVIRHQPLELRVAEIRMSDWKIDLQHSARCIAQIEGLIKTDMHRLPLDARALTDWANHVTELGGYRPEMVWFSVIEHTGNRRQPSPASQPAASRSGTPARQAGYDQGRRRREGPSRA